MSQNLPYKRSALPAPIKLGVALALALVLLVAVFAPLYLSLAKSAAPPERPAGAGTATADSPLPRGKLWNDLGINLRSPAAPNSPTDGSGNVDILYEQSCMEQVAGINLNCTANDVSISDAVVIEILDDGCAYPGDLVVFKAIFDVLLTAQARYDIGVYFTEDGTSALDGPRCTIFTPPLRAGSAVA